VRGTLEAFDQFGLQIKLESGETILVYKHAVTFLAPDLDDYIEATMKPAESIG